MTRSRRGMALALALLGLIVIGALVAGGFAAARLEHQLGRNAVFAVQAAGAAEAGLAEVLAGWEGLGLGSLAAGDSTALPPVTLATGIGYVSTVRRLNAELYLVRVRGRRADADGGLLAERLMALLARAADTLATGTSPVAPLRQRAWISGF